MGGDERNSDNPPKVLKEAADIYGWEVMRERNGDR
jgi:hypothetical protein